MSPIHCELLLTVQRIDTHYCFYFSIYTIFKKEMVEIRIWKHLNFKILTPKSWKWMKNLNFIYLSENSSVKSVKYRYITNQKTLGLSLWKKKVKFERNFCDWSINKIDDKVTRNYNPKLF